MPQLSWEPFAVTVDFPTGVVQKCTRRIVRKLSDLEDVFYHEETRQQILQKEDPLIYEVQEVVVPEKEGQLIHGTSIIYPGRIGSEYYMTRGHYHRKAGTAEIYLCTAGEGYLLLRTKDGRHKEIFLHPGTSAYAPPEWAHRTVNSGKLPFVCFYVVPADAGHDYQSLQKNDFRRLEAN